MNKYLINEIIKQLRAIYDYGHIFKSQVMQLEYIHWAYNF